MNVDYIIFDNDGTLYQMGTGFKERVVGSMIKFLSRRIGIPERQVIEERKRLIEKYGVESTEFVFGVEYGINHSEFVRKTYLLVPIKDYGAINDRKLQQMLQNIKPPKSILTNNPSEFARKIIRTLGVEQFFKHVIGSKEISYRLKPDKKAFLTTADITGCDLKRTVFIDDVPEFLYPAKELGMTTVLLSKDDKFLSNGYIDYQIKEIYDLENLVRGGIK